MLHRLSVKINRVVIQLAFVYVEFTELNLTLQARQRVIVELNLAGGHASYHDDLLVLSVRKALIYLRTIEKFERDLLYDTVLLVNVARELHNHMRVTIRHDESLLED